jgi:hypothetical protein
MPTSPKRQLVKLEIQSKEWSSSDNLPKGFSEWLKELIDEQEQDLRGRSARRNTNRNPKYSKFLCEINHELTLSL